LGVSFISSCTSPDPRKKTEINPEQEEAFEQMAASNLLMHSYGLSSDRKATFRLQGMATKLAQSAGVKTVAARLVFGNGFANAYPAPGNMMMITDNLFVLAKTDDELAALIAHQIGHILAGHPIAKLKQMTTKDGYTGTNAIAASDLKNPNAPINNAAKELSEKVIELKYTPAEEQEAEAGRLKIMTAAGYRPDAMMDLLISLKRASLAVNREPEYFAVHPPRP
jgi:predicted Zn-dependent protease